MTERRMVVGLMGPAQAGKTSVAVQMAALHGGRVISFADPIRTCLRSVGVTKENWPGLYRKLAQAIGNECRAHNQDWWVTRAEIEIAKLNSEMAVFPKTLIFDDVRFPNEVNYLLELRDRGLADVHMVYVDSQRALDMGEPFREDQSETLGNSLHKEFHQDLHRDPNPVLKWSASVGDHIWVVRNVPDRVSTVATELFNSITKVTAD